MSDHHYVRGSESNHFFGRCHHCDAHYLARMPLGRVEGYWELGVISTDQLDGYRALWAELSPHGANPHWRARANEHTEMIREARQCA